MDLVKIQQKLKNDEYETLSSIKEDFDLLFKNMCEYLNHLKENNQEDARNNLDEEIRILDKFIEVFKISYVKLENGEELGEEVYDEAQELNDNLEELLATIVTATDTAHDPNRLIHLSFRLLPSQKRYPEYYKFIKHPLDLKTIATKIIEGEYHDLNGLEEDLTIMAKTPLVSTNPEVKFIETLNKY